MHRILPIAMLLGTPPHSEATWSPGARAAISRLSANAPNLEVESVGESNLLARWSCGAPCEMATLLDPAGHSLAQLSFPEVSPDRSHALSIDPLDLKTGDANLALIDLETGKRLASLEKEAAVFVDGCAARWETTMVVIPACGARKTEIRIKWK